MPFEMVNIIIGLTFLAVWAMAGQFLASDRGREKRVPRPHSMSQFVEAEQAAKSCRSQ